MCGPTHARAVFHEFLGGRASPHEVWSWGDTQRTEGENQHVGCSFVLHSPAEGEKSEANTLTLATRSATAEDDMAGAGPSDLGMASDDVHAGLQPSTIIYQGKKGYKMVRHYLMGDMLGEGAQGKVKEAGALPHLALGRCSASP